MIKIMIMMMMMIIIIIIIIIIKVLCSITEANNKLVPSIYNTNYKRK